MSGGSRASNSLLAIPVIFLEFFAGANHSTRGYRALLIIDVT